MKKLREIITKKEHQYTIDTADLTEKVNSKSSVRDWIREYVNSDHPKFKGKSREERTKMALKAYHKRTRRKYESGNYRSYAHLNYRRRPSKHTDGEKD